MLYFFEKFLNARIISLLIVITALQSMSAQDPVYSQYYNAPIQLNPGLTGNTFTPKVSLNYRNQWPSLPLAYTTYAISYDQFFEKFNSGIGAFITTDDAGKGIYKTNTIALSYAYSLEMRNNNFIKIGIEPSIIQTRLDYDKLVFYDQIDGETGVVTPGGSNIPGGEIRPDNLNKVSVDFTVGLVYFNPKFHVGISGRHLNTPNLQFFESGKDESIYGIPLRVSIHTGGQIEMKNFKMNRTKSYFSPQFLYTTQGPFHQINIGGEMNVSSVYFGLFYRNVFSNSDAIIGSFGFETGLMKVMYSYDFTVSGLGIGQGGAHEISMQFLFNQPKKKQDYNDCFEIFR